MKNITLSLDEDILTAGQEYAKNQNISFNSLIRKLLEQTIHSQKHKWLDDTFSLMDKVSISTEKKQWTRDELYRE
ncbi:hypothetical protein E4O03_09750 [Treponema sp. OMZ 792]|uniref:DUF6364 family protein n=1 Tax=unclassified Treponema TaxID=2638727 RepID=UPI0020A59AD8|nr:MULTISPECIES: DUF6364 family protein [unclassified Treponema]UTC63096.1 hypothetical protein E4O05_04150 [Treponema sp. OMZ 787]UTC64074.1 hypothetical protein E4O00_09430 [Treponema sp. OMZ 788]UTC74491.1 hypothetical protein E4O03_09750 [Treponema sp. OMZ 792]UTC77234.1 hypothetical protein E4O04_04105 [Treponema sp. OMZ 799]UTC80887.1 hypothetical protein E4O07_09655 [Treponema sp. OMZ 798]